MAEKKPQDTQKRNMLFLGGIAVVAIGSVLVYTYKNSQEKVSEGAVDVSGVPRMNTAPSASDSEAYNNSVREHNQKGAEDALNTGSKSHLPTLTGDTSMQTINPLDLIEKAPEPPVDTVELEKIQEKERELIMPTIETPQEPVYVAPVQQVQQVAAPVAKYGQQDFIVLEALLGLQTPKRPASEFTYRGDTSGLEAAKEAEAKMLEQYKQNQTVNNGTNPQQNGTVELRAGDIMQAVLETEINSKEPSPVTAKVITGKFAGSRLIGSIQTVGKKVVLQFSTIAIPNYPRSLPISAVAIDLNTSRTALASDVDNHYFLKYGLLLGSAFLRGWSNAIATNNQTTQISDNGVITVNTGNKTSKEINREALGDVGTELSAAVRQEQSLLSPTIKVYKETAIGLLILSDFVK